MNTILRNTTTERESRLRRAMPIINIIEKTDLLAALDRRYRTGRRGHPNRIFLRSYILSFLMGGKYNNDLLRLLDENQDARDVCGLLVHPHRTSYNRFINKLVEFQANIDESVTQLVSRIKEYLPDLGDVVAIDSTDVSTYKHPYRGGGDPTADIGTKTSTKDKNGNVRLEQFYGFKFHLLADVTYGIPMHESITPASQSDTLTLEPMVRNMLERYDWVAPHVLVGDRGYDSSANFNYLWRMGIHPVIKIRNQTRGKLRDGKYDKDGIPQCQHGTQMWYAGSDQERGFHYLCPLADSHECEREHWVDWRRDLRFFGTIARKTPLWKSYYGMRYAIERVFMLMKRCHRLEHHTVHGIDRMHVHVAMSTLVYVATVLYNLQTENDVKGAPLTRMVPNIP